MASKLALPVHNPLPFTNPAPLEMTSAPAPDGGCCREGGVSALLPCSFGSGVTTSPGYTQEALMDYPGRIPPKVAFLPSPAELRQSLAMLDSNKDGKVWPEDVSMLLDLAYGMDSSRGSPSWDAFQEASTTMDGLVHLPSLLSAVDSGYIFVELVRMPTSARVQAVLEAVGKHAQQRHGCGQPQADLSLGPFRSLAEYMEAFNALDVDGNGVVCPRDLKQTLESLSGQGEVSLQECKELIRTVDENVNGVVDLIEFGKFVFRLADLTRESLQL